MQAGLIPTTQLDRGSVGSRKGLRIKVLCSATGVDGATNVAPPDRDKRHGHCNLIPHYGERYRNGEPSATGFVESTVNAVVSKRFRRLEEYAKLATTSIFRPP